MTVVSHPHRFVFLKTHKTASTSVEMLLEPLCRAPGWDVVKTTREAHSSYGIVGRRHGGKAIPFRLFNWKDHMSASRCRRALGRKRWDQYTKIATVRNPFDRMLSYYFWFNEGVDPSRDDPKTLISGFREFVSNSKWDDDLEIVTVDGKFIVDHSVRYENIADDLKKIISELGLPLSADDLPQSNVSANKKRGAPIEEYYDRDTIEIIRKRQAWVFDNFDYPINPKSIPASNEVPS